MNKKIKLEFTTDNLAVPEIQVDALSDADDENGAINVGGVSIMHGSKDVHGINDVHAKNYAHVGDSSAVQPDSENVEEEENEEFYDHLAFPEYRVKKPSTTEEQ